MSHGDEPMDLGLFGAEDAEASLDPFLVALAKAADLCLKPYRHALRFSGEPPTTIGDCSDCVVLIEARGADGARSAASTEQNNSCSTQASTTLFSQGITTPISIRVVTN